MMRKNSNDDEIPLTESRSTILQETKARFDTLLKAARSQDDDEKTDEKRGKRSNLKTAKKRAKKKLSNSTQMLVSEEDFLSSSEMDVPKYSPKVLTSSTLEEVRDFTSVSSSDELMLSPERSVSKTYDSEVEVPSIDSVAEFDILNTPPKRPAPLPQKRTSTRAESRETTSSRVSSSDSVMTAIEASSLNRSVNLSSPENETPKKGEVELYELKPLKGFSPSYEEIDEMSLKGHEGNRTAIEQTSSRLANAASYEEILEEQNYVASPERHSTDSNRLVPNESVKHEKRKRQNKKAKLQISQHKHKDQTDFDNTETSSDNRVQMPIKHRRKKSTRNESAIPSHTKIEYNYEKIIGISLHRCDSLKIDSLIRHPMVRVHVLDTLTGQYLKKSQTTRNVSFFQESPNIDYIQPLTSQPCQFKDPRSLTPIWEETLVLNEDIQHILQPQSSILILFEILDCVSFDEAIAQYQKLGLESGWHRIAWAFLKPCGANNVLNIDKKLRLQLYRPRSDKTYRGRSDCDKCDVYKWWRKGGWIQYPSTLLVTVYGLPMPADVPPSLRSYCALQPEHSGENFDTNDSTVNNASGKIQSRSGSPVSVPEDVVWSRLPSQSCKIPNKSELDLLAGISGNFSIKFSHRGHHLAVTATHQTLHNIHVYKIPEGLQVACFQGHPGLIYSLDWSQSDELLLSASADCTACVWSVKSQKYAPLQMLPHPSFVYSAIFLETNSLSLATGCCDHVIRIWTQSDQTGNFELQHELNGHEGYVSTICANSSGIILSGDSVGQIRIWQCQENELWIGLRVLNVRELQGVVLSHLVLHPGGKRLLALTRDSLLRMIDIGTGVAIQWFKGALNHRIHSKACISPCGSLVFSPSEDGTFHVWNADTGVLVASYSGLFHNNYNTSSQDRSSHRPRMSNTILSGAVDYHPFDHLIAFALYGPHTPVIVCRYVRNLTGKEIGLQIMSDKQNEHLENESSEKHSKLDQIAKSAVIVSNIKSQIHQRKNKHSLQQPLGVQSSPGVTVGYASNDERAKKGEKQHLSYIIKQLDYVLQLGRASNQKQLGIVTPQQSSPRSTSVTSDSFLQVGSRPHLLGKFESDRTTQKVTEIATAVSYSFPHSYATMQQQQLTESLKSKETILQSQREDKQMPVPSPVELHYVQEKPPRPAPRQKKSKRLQMESRQSIADFSTTDTSLMSSENEDMVKSVQAKTEAFQFVLENEVNKRRNSKGQSPMYRKVQVKHCPQQLSSFDSDSDDQPTKMLVET